MKKFLPKIPKFLKYGAALMAGGFYIWAIIILLNNDNWIGISALTTMFLAIAAFWAIRQNYSLQQRERRERLLNEIIEWATNACELALIESISNPSQLTGIKATNFLLDRTQEVERFRLLRARSVYAGKIAMKYPKLKQVVEDLTNKIREQIQLLFQFKEQMPKEEKDLHKAAKKAFLNNEKIYNAAIEVIEKTSDLV